MKFRILIIFQIIGFALFGQEMLTSSRYEMSGLGAGSDLVVSDPMLQMETPSSDYKVDRRFRLELEYNRNTHSDRMDALHWTLSVVVKNLVTTQQETLLLDFSPTGEGKYSSWADFTGTGSSMSWQIQSVTVQKYVGGSLVSGSLSELPLQDIHIEAMVFNDRFVNLSSTLPKMSINGNELSWDYVLGGVEYDVEWVFINDLDNFVYNSLVPSGPFDFKEGVRITTYKHSHKLDLIYPKGTLYFRVRAKGYQFKTGSKEVYYSGKWSYGKKVGTGNMSYVISSDFEGLKNWQYSVSYAENGQSKSSITYYDGSLRARQQLSQLSTGGEVVAGASLYDYEGRQSVTVIPTPINGNSLNYYNQLHRDVLGGAFDKEDFDNGVSQPMGTSTGAGAYYSSSNPLTSDPFRDRIPDAEGYPYTQISYINDNTGRVRKSSGVGLTHRMGGGHESVAYYVKPTERDLRELFGSNVGDVRHYTKEVVTDVNGQGNVSYLDQQGRVIASGLIGGSPSNLESLDNNPSSSAVTVTADLLSNNMLSYDENGNIQSVSNYYHLNVGTNPITLHYDLVSGGLNSLNQYFGTSGCASCFYELEIKVYAPNGSLVFLNYTSQTAPQGSQATIYERYSGSQLSCSSGVFDASVLPITHVQSLNMTGEYRIEKILRVDQAAVSAYISANGMSLPGAPNLASIENAYLSDIITTDCGLDCSSFYEQECREDFGYPLSGELNSSQKADVAACIASKCTSSVLEVENSTEPEADECSMVLGLMKNDVSPGGWVFDEDLAWRSQSSNWALSYTLSAGGTYTPSTIADLEANWETGWENLLVTHHPEYCHYEKCLSLSEINHYAVELNQITTMLEAESGGYVASGTHLFLAGNDPLNSNSMYSSTFSSYLSGVNTNYSNTSGSIYDAVEDMIIVTPSLLHNEYGVTLTGDPAEDRKWLLMRNLYLGDRANYIEANYPVSCTYYANENAHYINPTELTTPGTTGASTDATNENCSGICNNNVSYWMSRITEECNALSAGDIASIQGHLQNYCLSDCDGLLNQTGGIQMSDLLSSNTDLAAVSGLLTGCGFSLWDLAIDDTCASPVMITYTDVPMYPLSVKKNLALLTSISSTSYGTFITMPSITSISNYGTKFPLTYWNNGMTLRLSNTTTSSNTDYLIQDISSISIVNSVTSNGFVEFTVSVLLQNGSTQLHVINQFSLSQSSPSGWSDFAINLINSKETVSGYVCDDNTNFLDVAFTLEDWVADCVNDIEQEATELAEQAYLAQLESFINGLALSFSSSCFGSNLDEQFSLTYVKQEYAFTLYYYDQAGNLVQTVPPQGVHIVPSTGFNAQGEWLNVEPVHLMKTMYTYNALNQLVKSETPDGGVTTYWYNGIQQLRYSQNAVQAQTGDYSYVRYDALGRPFESGVFTPSSFSTALTNIDNANYPLATALSPSKDVVRTYYHKQTLNLDNSLGWSPQELNMRVAAVASYESYTGNNDVYTHAIYYDYDIHGNVKRLLTDFPSMGAANRYKLIEYVYDLYSGKMLDVVYQGSKEDQYLHHFSYDADNRLISVKTSRDGVVWDEDASYYYYLHGPLARVELGEDKVQGIDYAYTVHGWLKGVNSNTAVAQRDLGKDGASMNVANKWVGQDAFGYSLTYYNTTGEVDYKPIVATTSNWLAANESSYLPAQNANLYNGNIRSMVTALRDEANALVGTVARVYKYDQLQRLKEARTYTASNLTSSNSWTGATSTDAHYSSYSYDLNGNITKLLRNGNTGALALDNLKYVYYNNDGGAESLPKYKNQLAQVQDLQTNDAAYGDDINSGQLSTNYVYDAIGRLIEDKQEQIALIKWNAQNKVTLIQHTSTSTKDDVSFKYDAMGNRVMKVDYPKNANGTINTAAIKTTYYILDGTGNVMATYTQWGSSPTSTKLNDFEIYGAKRLGTENVGVTLASTPVFNYCSEDNRASAIVELKITTFSNAQQVIYKVGTTALNTAYTWNTAQSIASNVNGLVASINQQTVTTDISARIWWSNNASGTYYVEFSYGQPGNWQGQAFSQWVNGVAQTSNIKRDMGLGTCKGYNIVGNKSYELSNHLGNVLEVITDRKVGIDDGVYNLTTGAKTSSVADGITDYYLPTIISHTDYDPFGTEQAGRKGSSAGYRYGYQGSEGDDEIKGEGNSYTTFFRQLDPRLGRWLSIDPKMNAWESPYVSMANNPLLYNDPLGDKIKYSGTRQDKRELKRMIRQAKREDSDFKDWYKDRKKESKINYFHMSDHQNTDEGNYFMALKYTDASLTQVSKEGVVKRDFADINIGEGGKEDFFHAGTKQGSYYFNSLEKKKHEPIELGVSVGLRIYNVVLIDIQINRTARWESYFPGRNGVKKSFDGLYYIPKGEEAHQSYPEGHSHPLFFMGKEWLIPCLHPEAYGRGMRGASFSSELPPDKPLFVIDITKRVYGRIIKPYIWTP